MTENKNSFILYSNYYEILKDLSDEDAGILFKAILQYQATKEEIKLPANIAIAFKFIKNQFDIDDKKYKEYSEKQKANGLKGGRPKTQKNPKNPPVFLETQKSLNDNVNDNDNDNDNVFKEKEKEKEKKSDPYISQTKILFISEYEKIFNTRPFLSSNDCNKLLELSINYADLPQLIPKALKKLKSINFKDIDFTPSASWLLKSDNFERVMNGEFDKKEEKPYVYNPNT